MLAPAKTIQGNELVLIKDLPIIQQKALSATTSTLPYAEYRSWYLDLFYPDKALQTRILLEWLVGLIKKHQALDDLASHRKAIITHIECKGNDHYYLRAKVYSMPDDEGCKIEAEVKGDQIINFEIISYFPFKRHHDKHSSYHWKSFLVLGKKDGPFTMYHLNGSIMQKGYFNSGKRVGLWTSYSPEGKIISNHIYEFATAI